MPHLAFHMSVARELAYRVQSSIIEGDRGAYYLGSTGPDMHILSGTDRHSSHFFDLDYQGRQDSVDLFFKVYQDLRDPDRLNTGTAAFVGGYLTHLVIDELWITDIYRPFFGPESSLGGDARANIMDRVLQYDMDLQRRGERATMAEIRENLVASPLDVEVEFADDATLQRWRDVAVDMVSRPPSWDRFRYLAGRFLKGVGVETEEELEEFLKMIPQMLQEAEEHVGGERLQEFVDKVTALSMRALRGYMG
jgi:hypothetical protein